MRSIDNNRCEVELPDYMNVADYFLDARVRGGMTDRVALVCDDVEYTYGQVQLRAAHYASVFESLNIPRESRILLALPDGLDFVGAFFGTLKMGLVVVMANPEQKSAALVMSQQFTRAALVVCNAALAEQLQQAGSSCPVLTHDASKHSVTDFSAAPTQESWLAKSLVTHRDESAIWLFSGGTTGHPKVVMQPHGSFVNTTELYAKNVLQIAASDRTISVSKLFFGYATGSNLLFPFSVGASAVLFSSRCTPQTLSEQIEKHRPTILINVPTMASKLLKHAQKGTVDFSSLRLSTSAGEALPKALYSQWKQRFGVELLDGFGTAEMWHVFLTNHIGDVRPGSLGKPVAGFDLSVRDQSGVELGADEVGWLRVRGRSRALGYWLAHDESERVFIGDCYQTGDMVRRDADGYYYYCGRTDDMLKVSGKWLSPREVEDCLANHPAVVEVVVVVACDDEGLEKPYAFVVVTPAEEVSRNSCETEGVLRRHVQEVLDYFKAPKQIYVVPALPKTHLGKADRNQLRMRVGSENYPHNR